MRYAMAKGKFTADSKRIVIASTEGGTNRIVMKYYAMKNGDSDLSGYGRNAFTFCNSFQSFRSHFGIYMYNMPVKLS